MFSRWNQLPQGHYSLLSNCDLIYIQSHLNILLNFVVLGCSCPSLIGLKSHFVSGAKANIVGNRS